jgi:hypothetical protein
MEDLEEGIYHDLSTLPALSGSYRVNIDKKFKYGRFLGWYLS